MNFRVLPDSLWLLIWLNLRSRLRRVRQGLRSARSVLVWSLVLGGLGFALFIQTQIRSGDPADASVLKTYVPFGLFSICVINLLAMQPNTGIPFRPAEIEFLFPGPFRRQDLLLFRIVANSLALLFPAAMVTVFATRFIPIPAAGVIGSYLGLQFITLFQMVQVSASLLLREHLVRQGRIWLRVAVALIVLIVIVVVQYSSLTATELIRSAVASWAGRVVLAPFHVFGQLMGAQTAAELGLWATIAVAMDVGMIWLLLRLDANWLEASVATSQRVHQQLKQVSQGRVAWWRLSASAAKRRIPLLPRLGGAGPIAWRQLTSARRAAGGVLMTVALVCIGPLLPMLYLDNENFEAPLGIGMVVISLMVIPQFLQFDFRGDVDRMDVLRTLPVPPLAIVCGQLIAPVVALTLLQLMMCLSMLIAGFLNATTIAIVLLFLLPANVLIFGVENLVFLWFPYRMPVPGTVDVQATFRHMVLMMLKMLLTMTLGGTAAGLGALASWLAGESPVVFVTVSWLAAVAAAVSLIPLAVQAFERFDPAKDRA